MSTASVAARPGFGDWALPRLATLWNELLAARYGAPPPGPDEEPESEDLEMRMMIALICAAHV